MTNHEATPLQNGLTSAAGEFFKQLSPEALRDFESMQYHSSYAGGSILFLEKHTPTAVYIVLEGQVKLSMSSSEGRRLILRVAKAGEIIGLNSAITGHPFDVTAETVHGAKIATIRTPDFMGFLLRYPAAYQNVVRQLSTDYNNACEQLRTVGLSPNAQKKLARLLLEWCAAGQQTDRGTRVKVSLTHEEIGEFIGATRETVTRTLSEFKHQHLVALNGSTMMIPNRVALEHYAGV
jgi:CRP/FNR family cyclic AMP-dependent transcriptional regulator